MSPHETSRWGVHQTTAYPGCHNRWLTVVRLRSVDSEAVRTFVLAARLGQLQHAADDLGVTQQAVSKRIAALERELGVRLFARNPRGVELTVDGQAFLTHARNVVAHVDRAVSAVRPGSRALRIDVLGLRSAQAVVLHDYWRAHPEVDLDVVTIRASDARNTVAAVQSGEVDATFRTITDPAALPDDVRMVRAFDSALELLVGPSHPLAGARTLTPSQLRGHRIWVPGITPGTEWAEFYQQLTAAFDLRVDAAGPNFGTEVLLDALVESSDLATLVGARDRYVWPNSYDLRRIPIAEPTIGYPISLILPKANPHPGLQPIIRHCRSLPPLPRPRWLPSWAAEEATARNT